MKVYELINHLSQFPGDMEEEDVPGLKRPTPTPTPTPALSHASDRSAKDRGHR